MQKTSAYVNRPVRVAYVQVIGKIWMPAITCSMDYTLSDSDLENIGRFNRENVEQWLSTHAGDFQSVKDFRAVCGDTVLDWLNEESELTYNDCMFPSED